MQGLQEQRSPGQDIGQKHTIGRTVAAGLGCFGAVVIIVLFIGIADKRVAEVAWRLVGKPGERHPTELGDADLRETCGAWTMALLGPFDQLVRQLEQVSVSPEREQVWRSALPSAFMPSGCGS